MDGNFTIGRFGGVEVRLNWSLIAVFALIVWSLTEGVFPSQNPGLSHGTYLAMAIVAALLFLASILLHELGHSWVARHEGIEVDSITLWLFGGVSQFKGRFTSAGAEFRVAISGPLVSIVLGVVFVLIALSCRAPSTGSPRGLATSTSSWRSSTSRRRRWTAAACCTPHCGEPRGMRVKRRRRLHKLVPDAELIRRRAAGEPVRELAPEYEVAHTTLVRYFARPDVRKQLGEAAKQLREEKRALAERRAHKSRLESNVRREAREQAAREREQARLAGAAERQTVSRSRRPRSDYAAWLDERDARMPLTRADLHSQNDETAARVVAAGGGMQDVIDATDLRTLENVVRLIDPAILKQAYDNDLLRQAEFRPT
jgi:hypothetical protein